MLNKNLILKNKCSRTSILSCEDLFYKPINKNLRVI